MFSPAVKQINRLLHICKRRHSVVHRVHLARCKGLEPLTYWFVASHPIQLS